MIAAFEFLFFYEMEKNKQVATRNNLLFDAIKINNVVVNKKLMFFYEILRFHFVYVISFVSNLLLTEE